MSKVRSTTMRVDDLESAVRDFASALDTQFTWQRHPTFDVDVAVSPVVWLVSSSSLPPGRGPLVEVAFDVDDPETTAAKVAALGIAVRRVVREGSRRHSFDFHGLPMAIDISGVPTSASPSSTRFDRAVLAVNDLASAAADLKAALGIELTTFDVDNMRIRVGLGDDGIEFLSRMDPVIDIEASWNETVAGFAVQVQDLGHSRERMSDLGIDVTHEFTTEGGMLEVFYGRPGLHGVPTTLIPFHEEGSLIDAMGLTEGMTDVSPKIG